MGSQVAWTRCKIMSRVASAGLSRAKQINTKSVSPRVKNLKPITQTLTWEQLGGGLEYHEVPLHPTAQVQPQPVATNWCVCADSLSWCGTRRDPFRFECSKCGNLWTVPEWTRHLEQTTERTGVL
jgi:hypothetical protein